MHIEEYIIRQRYGLDGETPKIQRDIAKMCGISRSAFYKYRDFVFAYKEMANDSIINLSAVLEDKAGVLSDFISALQCVVKKTGPL